MGRHLDAILATISKRPNLPNIDPSLKDLTPDADLADEPSDTSTEGTPGTTGTTGSSRTTGSAGTKGTANTRRQMQMQKWDVEVTKMDVAKRRVFGWALISKTRDGQPVVDLQGDCVEPDEMEEAAYDFVKHARVGGEMHEGAAPATLIESIAMTPEKAAAMGIPAGAVPTAHYVGFEVPQETFDRVRAGKRLMFSVEGSGERVPL